jgi:hypothetical protein
MRTVTLQSILLRAWQRSGNDGSDISNIPSGARTMMVAAANERIADCWEWADWPELCRVESRTVQGNETSGYYIDYEQPGETAVGEVFAVLRDNPATHVAPREIPYTLLGDAIRFPEATSLPTTVYVRYRLRPIDVQARVTAIGMTAALLENIYPAVLAKAVAYLLTGDLLEEDGQMDKAMLMEQKAESELISQRDKYVFQQNQPTMWSARVNQY